VGGGDHEGPLPGELRLGWECSGDATDTVWFDDIRYTASHQRQWCR
jgi:hypothetical protein